MLRDMCSVGEMKYAILRYFNVAGADPLGRSGQLTAEPTHLIERACLAALGRVNGLEIFGADYDTPDWTCIRDYIHVSDLIDAHILSLDHLAKGGDNLVLNCGYGRGFSVHQVVRSVERAAGKSLGANFTERREGDPPELIADAKRLRERRWAGARNMTIWTPSSPPPSHGRQEIPQNSQSLAGLLELLKKFPASPTQYSSLAPILDYSTANV